MSEKIGVINEVGDMGLGFNELSEKEAVEYKNQQKQQPKKETSKKDHK